MKRYILSTLILLLLCLCGCTKGEEKQQAADPVDVTVTQSYDLNELREFFVPHHMDRAPHTGELDGEFAEKKLTYNEVDLQYPAVLLKTANPFCKYIMYLVDQGGFYYVFLGYFWTKELGEQTPETTDYMYVLFSAYLGDVDSDAAYSNVDYYNIKPGTTTMSDVIKSDPNAESVFLSGGTYTCSLLDNSTVLQILYRHNQDAEEPDRSFLESMIVREVSVVKIEDSVSLLAYVSPLDREDG